jgi:hypothetical protein
MVYLISSWVRALGRKINMMEFLLLFVAFYDENCENKSEFLELNNQQPKGWFTRGPKSQVPLMSTNLNIDGGKVPTFEL